MSAARRTRARVQQVPVQAGLTLVELLVAMAIGIFLMAGAVSVFGKTRDLYRTNDAAARLQETARYAMSTIESDLRMANYWGLNNRADLVSNAAGEADPVPGALSGFEARIDACGNNWAVNVFDYVEGNNNGYGLTCAAFGAGATAFTDVLTVRRASVNRIADADLTNGPLKVSTSRVQGSLFTDATPPGPLAESRLVLVHGYYVARDSDIRPGTPSLRRKRADLTAAAGVVDEEITSGIEDLQFEIGVDCGTGRPTACAAGVVPDDQTADYYVNPAAVIPDADRPVSVRVWILARAEQPEVGFTDDNSYEYADRDPFVPGDGFRRILVSKTIALRNTRQ